MAPLDGFEVRLYEWPEIDTLNLTGIQNGKEIKLRSYHWPMVGERKAVVFMMHGYGSNCAQMGVLAKYLAASGTEVFGMDMRGMGYSEGARGVSDTTEDCYDDYWGMIFAACK